MTTASNCARCEIRRTIGLSGENLTLTSFRNELSGREYIQAGAVSREIRLTADGETISGADGKWTLVRDETRNLPQGELELVLTLRHGGLEIAKIGRIWMQAGARSDVARTFVVPAKGWLSALS